MVFGVYLETRRLLTLSPVSALPPMLKLTAYTKIYFEKNQLSLGTIGILPLSTSRPKILQYLLVRASILLSENFTLLMDSSPSFGSYPSS